MHWPSPVLHALSLAAPVEASGRFLLEGLFPDRYRIDVISPAAAGGHVDVDLRAGSVAGARVPVAPAGGAVR